MAENNGVRRPESAENDARARSSVKRGAVRSRRNPKTFLNLFDLLIIFVILLTVVLLAVGIRMTDVFGGSDEGTPVVLTYTLTLFNVDAAFADQIVAGDVLYDVDTKVALGTVQQTPTVEPHREIALLTASDGKVSAVMQQVPQKVDITVRVTVEATDLPGIGYTVEGKPVRIGKTFAVRFPSYIGQAECVALNGAQAISQ